MRDTRVNEMIWETKVKKGMELYRTQNKKK